MKAFQRFESGHNDFIHDIAYDYYGKRLATCSSDQSIKIWDQDQDGSWKQCGKLENIHTGPINKLSWAHPEHGQILASCSADRVVNIYEEQMDMKARKPLWKKHARLVDSRQGVRDIQFAPRHAGLKLATASLDGRVRVYESTDVMNLSVWQLVEEFEATKDNCNCVSWSDSSFEPPMMVVGTQGSGAQVWQYFAKYQKWQVVCDLEKSITKQSSDRNSSSTLEQHVPRQFKGHQAAVHDCAFAPNMARSYHLIATACKDHAVRIFKLTRDQPTGRFQSELLCEARDHQAEVWRVSWNITGTLLASTGDDGSARLWKSDLQGKWKSLLQAVGHSTTARQQGDGDDHTVRNNAI